MNFNICEPKAGNQRQPEAGEQLSSNNQSCWVCASILWQKIPTHALPRFDRFSNFLVRPFFPFLLFDRFYISITYPKICSWLYSSSKRAMITVRFINLFELQFYEYGLRWWDAPLCSTGIHKWQPILNIDLFKERLF